MNDGLSLVANICIGLFVAVMVGFHATVIFMALRARFGTRPSGLSFKSEEDPNDLSGF